MSIGGFVQTKNPSILEGLVIILGVGDKCNYVTSLKGQFSSCSFEMTKWG